MTNKKGRPGQDGHNDTQTKDSTNFLDVEVNSDGKRKAGPPDLTAESLQKIMEKLPSKLDSLHFKILRTDSSISPEIMADRSPRSITADNLQALQWFGFFQTYGPALVLPYFDREGAIIQADLRFDRPVKMPDGKIQRYLSPPGLPKRLDFPPGPFLEDGDVWLVEGIKKADSARSRGLYAIGLPGIWSLGERAKEARADLEALPLDGRVVVVVLDTETKPKAKKAVEKARTKLCRYLAELGAIPKVVILPEPPDGTGKTGLDDFFVSGATVDDLMGLVQDPEPPWRDSLVISETGVIRATSWNIRQILENDEEFEPIRKCRFNELVKRPELEDGRPIDTPMATEVGSLIEGRFRTASVSFETLSRVIELIAMQNPVHPIKAWLEALPPWDGIPRIDGLFPAYYGARDSPFVRSVGRNLMIAAVARIFRPGCKHDHIVVLEGDQGILKSTGIAILFGQDWTTTSRADISSKDFVSGILGYWAVELSELASLRKSQVESIKAVLSVTEDDVRLPYRRDTKRYPRQSVFLATTNQDDYLQDGTGNRRFWPIRCQGKIDLAGLKRDRDQIFAEAVQRFGNGDSWWEVPDQSAKEEQDARIDADVWTSPIASYLNGQTETTTARILSYCFAIEEKDHNLQCQQRIGRIMKSLKWIRMRKPTGNRDWVYVPLPKQDGPIETDKRDSENLSHPSHYVPLKSDIEDLKQKKDIPHDTHILCNRGDRGENNGTKWDVKTVATPGRYSDGTGTGRIGRINGTLPHDDAEVF